MSLEASQNYTNSALRVGDADPYPQRLIGEFIGTVVANDWVNKSTSTLILKVHEHALERLCRASLPLTVSLT